MKFGEAKDIANTVLFTVPDIRTSPSKRPNSLPRHVGPQHSQCSKPPQQHRQSACQTGKFTSYRSNIERYDESKKPQHNENCGCRRRPRQRHSDTDSGPVRNRPQTPLVKSFGAERRHHSHEWHRLPNLALRYQHDHIVAKHLEPSQFALTDCS
jgi:hypothetical protein